MPQPVFSQHHPMPLTDTNFYLVSTTLDEKTAKGEPGIVGSTLCSAKFTAARFSADPAYSRIFGGGCITRRAASGHQRAPGLITTSTARNLPVLPRPRWRFADLADQPISPGDRTLVP